MDKIIRFDWAMKRILRDKANFIVLEGFVSTVLNQKIEIVELLESEANQEYNSDKFNRVDIKAKDSRGEIIIIEIQTTRERCYLQRILYGTAKAITEHIKMGDSYDKVQKVYSINILYFDLGTGKDYVYHGQTKFIGVNTHDELRLTDENRNGLELYAPDNVFPEYYLVRVNVFDKLTAETPLEEWLDYLKNNEIREEVKAPGLREAQERLRYVQMDEAERSAYTRHLENVMYENDVLSQAHIDGHEKGRAEGRAEGHAEGRAEGLAEGRAEGLAEGRAEGLEQGRKQGIEQGRVDEKLRLAAKLKEMGQPVDFIIEVTGLTREEIAP